MTSSLPRPPGGSLDTAEGVRDMELTMACTLADSEVLAMETIAEAVADNANRIAVADHVSGSRRRHLAR